MPPLFEEVNLYDSPSGLLRFVRRLLNPILRLFFNPTPIAHALAVQGRLNADAAARETERERRQAEWNALHYEILQRLVTEVARVSLEAQSLSLRVESLGASVDFNDRRVRAFEGTQVRAPRPQETASRTAAATRRRRGCATGPDRRATADRGPAGTARTATAWRSASPPPPPPPRPPRHGHRHRRACPRDGGRTTLNSPASATRNQKARWTKDSTTSRPPKKQ